MSERGGIKLESKSAAETPPPGGFVIGVDVGGSKVAAGLVNDHGEILGQTRVAMVSHGTASEGLNAVLSAVDSLSSECSVDPRTNAQLLGIGICAPGPLDPKSGVIVNPPNLPCWRNFPLAAEVANIYRVPVKVENDANAAALAEAQWGAGRGYTNVFYATIGTGIGTGIVLDGRIYHGRTDAAAEGGHISIDYQGDACGCGKRGCIEHISSSGTSKCAGDRRSCAAPKDRSRIQCEDPHHQYHVARAAQECRLRIAEDGQD